MQPVTLRIAILSSLGLLPLGCFADARDPGNGEVVSGVDGVDDDAGDTEQPDDTEEPTNEPPPVPVEAPACGDSVPVAQDEMGQTVYGYPRPTAPGVVTGIYRCDSGLLHRPEPTVCESGLPRPLPPEPEPGMPALTQVDFLYEIEQGSWPALCAADADCTEKAFGYCAPTYLGQMSGVRAACNYGCLEDSDCGDDFLCQCGDPVGQCVPATCRSDADCGADLKCGQWETQFICSTDVSYTCQSQADTCNTGADCNEREYCSGEGGVRSCVPNRALACGRPFLVSGEARTATLQQTQDWISPISSSSPGALPAAERLLIGEHWARAALMEHASIAAFARFTLQLLHLGAPRELIEQSQRAMLDETEHAKRCFELASRYLGTAQGPTALPMDDALSQNDLESVTLMAFIEGCLGETVATLEARAALEQASDPLVRSALERIAEDEQRHAELAWRFVRWALSSNAGLADPLMAELSRLERELDESLPLQGEDGVAAHGVLSVCDRAQVRRSALLEVVLPCGRALLGAHSGCLKMPSRAACQITATAG
jgi:hypothetical protein